MYRDAAPPDQEGPQARTRPLRRVRPGFLAVVALLLMFPTLVVAKAWLFTLFITLAVGAIVGLLLLPLLLTRRVVAVHENGITVRLPRAKRFVPWRDILSIEQTVGARGTIAFRMDVRDVGSVAFPVMFAINGGQLLGDVCAAAELHWVGTGPQRQAVRTTPVRVADDAGASDAGASDAGASDAATGELVDEATSEEPADARRARQN